MAAVNYVELFVAAADLEKTKAFYETVFDWNMQPFGAPDYFVQSRGDEPGIDIGLGAAADGVPAVAAAIRVTDIDQAIDRVEVNGGAIAVPKFAIPGVGQLAYFKDPNGFLMGLHQPHSGD